MKVVDRLTFMEYPAGTLYSKGKKWYFSELLVKGDTITSQEGLPIDWFEMEISWVNEIDNPWDLLEKSLKSGESFESNEYYGRDGMYDPDDLFLVFEKEDLEKLKENVETAISQLEART